MINVSHTIINKKKKSSYHSKEQLTAKTSACLTVGPTGSQKTVIKGKEEQIFPSG